MKIEERIAEVLHDHRELMSQNTAWDECKYCSHRGQTWAAHVASVLVAELELTQEWGAIHEGDSEPDAWVDDLEWAQMQVDEFCQSCDSCRNAQPKTLGTRYTTAWERAE